MKWKLVPCPFCGGTPVRLLASGDERDGYADHVTYTCKDCGCSRGARGDSGKGGYADNSTVEQRALERWNTRAAPPLSVGDVFVIAKTKRWFISEWNAKAPEDAGWHVGTTDIPLHIMEGIELVDRQYVTARDQQIAALQARVAELEGKARLETQLQRAAEVLPEGWMVMVEIEREGGGVTLMDPLGNDLDYPSNRESLADEVEDAIDVALTQQVTKP